MGRPRVTGAVALPMILVLAACSSGGGATASPSTGTAPSTAASPSSAASPSAEASPTSSDSASGGEYPLKVASGTSGSYLTGQDGLALYVFEKDTKDSGKSVCNGQCATNWPPYEADEVDEIEADAAITGTLSIVTRDDGSKQLAYNGWPLYYFAGDTAAGDTKGATIPNWKLATP